MPEVSPSKYRVEADWNDVPHLDETSKAELLASYPLHERDARSKGIPVLGSGAIYPIRFEDIAYDPFPIPSYWPRFYALDVGWKRTAALWFANDRDTNTLYVYAEHYLGRNLPSVHATAIKARGAWIPGVIDPASRGRSQIDGKQLITEYRKHGLVLTEADNSVEAGIEAVYELLSTGRLKVGRWLRNFQTEYRVYRRSDGKTKGDGPEGSVVKKMDHLMDCLRYGVMTGRRVAKVQPLGDRGTDHKIIDSIAGY